jgi:hypothetical protein
VGVAAAVTRANEEHGAKGTTKENVERWTHWRAFAQARRSSDIQLLPYSLVIAGLALFGLAQLVEGVGAFGFRGNDQVNFLATVHDLALVGVVGLPVALVGALLWVMLALAARAGVSGSRWVPYALLALAILVFIAYVILVVTDV